MTHDKNNEPLVVGDYIKTDNGRIAIIREIDTESSIFGVPLLIIDYDDENGFSYISLAVPASRAHKLSGKSLTMELVKYDGQRIR